MSTLPAELRIGTRGSALAMTQARDISARLRALGQDSRIEIIRTSGDADQTRPFAEVGAPGLFVREIESALIEGRIDVAVHCYKDLPSESPAGLTIAAMPEREDPRDRLLIRPEAHDPDADGLPVKLGARIGSASARRQALVKALRPDATCTHLRGNVPTRIEKLRGDDHDAILLASAGLHRLDRAVVRGEGEAIDRSEFIEIDLDPTLFVPAPSQGALALQVRLDDEVVHNSIARLDDLRPRRAVEAERELLALVEAGCQVPFGAYAEVSEDDSLELHAALEVGNELRRCRECGGNVRTVARAAYAALLPERCAD